LALDARTPAKYAREEFDAGRFPSMTIIEVAGSFYLGDNDWNILSGGKTYSSRGAAESDRSRILDRARVR
jgi:hypothetical protein